MTSDMGFHGINSGFVQTTLANSVQSNTPPVAPWPSDVQRASCPFC
jgi:hypothetical protein